jgi:hypothetical protein
MKTLSNIQINLWQALFAFIALIVNIIALMFTGAQLYLAFYPKANDSNFNISEYKNKVIQQQTQNNNTGSNQNNNNNDSNQNSNNNNSNNNNQNSFNRNNNTYNYPPPPNYDQRSSANKNQNESTKDVESQGNTNQNINDRGNNEESAKYTGFVLKHSGTLKIRVLKDGKPITFMGYSISAAAPDYQTFPATEVKIINTNNLDFTYANVYLDPSRWLLDRYTAVKVLPNYELEINGQIIPKVIYDYDNAATGQKSANYYFKLEKVK